MEKIVQSSHILFTHALPMLTSYIVHFIKPNGDVLFWGEIQPRIPYRIYLPRLFCLLQCVIVFQSVSFKATVLLKNTDQLLCKRSLNFC